jgi:glutathione S-transferase
MELTLYYMPGTRSERVRWALDELGLDYGIEKLDLFKGEGNRADYRAIHPLGQLPALLVDGQAMFESGAIVQWLAEATPGSRLAPPVDQPARRAFDQWMYFAATSLEAPAWEMMLHGNILPDEQAVKSIIPFATQQYQRALQVLDHALTGKDYLLGSDFSAADIMVGYLLPWFPEQLTECTVLPAYLDRLKQRPAYPGEPLQ